MTANLAPRRAHYRRGSAETDIELDLLLDGSGKTSIETGFGMLDHMLTLLAFWAEMDLSLTCKGDLHVDAHHTAEDIGLCLGAALLEALRDRAGIARVGYGRVPMDEAGDDAESDGSEMTDANVAAAEPAGNPMALGSAFHAACQWLIEMGADELPVERAEALARLWHLTPEQRGRFGVALNRWLRSSVRAELLAWPCVRAEVPFFSLGCEDEDIARYGAYAEGAIDALATDPADPSRALVIDYKTGGTPDETPDQLLEKHALQARVYADVLHKAGFENVTVKFVRVEQTDPAISVEPAEPQVVTYNL